MLEKDLSNDKSLEVNVAISQQNWVTQFLTRKMTGNGMNKNPENWQCEVLSQYSQSESGESVKFIEKSDLSHTAREEINDLSNKLDNQSLEVKDVQGALRLQNKMFEAQTAKIVSFYFAFLFAFCFWPSALFFLFWPRSCTCGFMQSILGS